MRATNTTREATAVDASAARGFLESFERHAPLRRAEPPWLGRLRNEAISRFAAMGLPSTRDEEWKYTNLTPLAARAYDPSPGAGGRADGAALAPYLPAECERLVFIDGRFDGSLSSLQTLPEGIEVRSIGDIWRGDLEASDHGLAELVEQQLGRVVDPALPFTALNTALAVDGALIYLQPDVELMRPLQLLHVSSGGRGRASHLRNLVVCGANSRGTLVESYASLGPDSGSLTNVVTEIVLGDGAHLEHLKLQLEAADAHHVARVEALQSRDSELRSLSFSFGGGLVRNDINTALDATGSSCSFYGLYVAGGAQHVDHHTAIDHRQPGCNSHEIYKGILGGRATSVFNGKVFVREGAVRTDARQSNRNLLLSADATVNTKPQLEIYADDVRCTHGATVGQLDEDALFYLRARGLSAIEARQALINGFSREIVEAVAHDPLRQLIEQQLVQRLGIAAGA